MKRSVHMVSSIHAVFEDQAEMKSINRFFEARLVACASARSRGGMLGSYALHALDGRKRRGAVPMLTSAMSRRLLLSFVALAVIGVLAAEGSAIAAVFPSNVSLAAQ